LEALVGGALLPKRLLPGELGENENERDVFIEPACDVIAALLEEARAKIVAATEKAKKSALGLNAKTRRTPEIEFGRTTQLEAS